MTDKEENIKKFLIDILATLVGAFLMATATSLFLLPNQLSSGGFAGIATILYYFSANSYNPRLSILFFSHYYFQYHLSCQLPVILN